MSLNHEGHGRWGGSGCAQGLDNNIICVELSIYDPRIKFKLEKYKQRRPNGYGPVINGPLLFIKGMQPQKQF